MQSSVLISVGLTAIAKVQNTHLHPTAELWKAPAIGPITGPNKGPNPKSAIAAPLLSAGTTSEMVPPPTVCGAEPAQPAKNLKANSIPTPLLRAHPTLARTNTRPDMWYMYLRPYISDKGAMTIGPMANPRRYIVTVKEAIVLLVIPNSVTTNFAAGAYIVEARFLYKSQQRL